MAAHTRWSRTSDRITATEPARQAWNDRWEKQVDPDLKLTPAERGQRAENAKRAHMLRMAMASAKARARRRAGVMTEQPLSPAEIKAVHAAEFDKPLTEDRVRDRKAGAQLKNLTGDEADQAYRDSQS